MVFGVFFGKGLINKTSSFFFFLVVFEIALSEGYKKTHKKQKLEVWFIRPLKKIQILTKPLLIFFQNYKKFPEISPKCDEDCTSGCMRTYVKLSDLFESNVMIFFKFKTFILKEPNIQYHAFWKSWS